MKRDYLLEIGCEEIPAGFVGPALWNGSQLLAESLRKARLSFDRIDICGTPRRLAYIVRDLNESQDSTEETVLGPPKSVAFDAAGNPSKAAAGFAKSQGVEIDALKLFTTDKGEYLGIVKSEASRPTAEILPKVAAEFIPAIPFRKSMRWADLDVRFVRPVQWLVSLFGEEVLPFAFGNIEAGNVTWGHRFLSSGPIALRSPAEYASALAAASVFVELEDRGMCPAEAVASAWNRTPRSRAIRPISATGWIVPISALACMTETSRVSGRIALRTSSGSTRPSRSTCTTVVSKPAARSGSSALRTEKCSTSETTRWRPFFDPAIAAPLTARLLASVAPEVNTISAG
jgi:hypothetical protein